MGWTSFIDNPAMKPGDILTREMSGTNENGATWEILDHATKPGQWYALCKFTAPNNPPVFYGMVCLFNRRKGEFSYKDMTETCGPSAARAPIRIIDQLDKLAPIHPADARQSAQWAIQWRARCRENAKRKPAPKIKAGDVVKFSDHGREFELIAPAGPRLGWHVKLSGEPFANIYRATARQIANCQIIKG